MTCPHCQQRITVAVQVTKTLNGRPPTLQSKLLARLRVKPATLRMLADEFHLTVNNTNVALGRLKKAGRITVVGYRQRDTVRERVFQAASEAP